MGVVLAALYVLLTYQKVFTGPAPERRTPVRELTRRERVVLWPLVALMIVLGFLPGIALDTLREPSADIVATVPTEEAGQ